MASFITEVTMNHDTDTTTHAPSAVGVGLFTIAGLGAAFGVAACCALPVLLTSAGIGAAWLAGVAALAAPNRPVLLALGVFALLVAAAQLIRLQRVAMTSSVKGAGAPAAVRVALLVGLLAGAALLVLGYQYA